MELELIHFLPGASEHLQVHKVSQMTDASYRWRRVGHTIAVALLHYAHIPLRFCWQGGHASRVRQTHAAGLSLHMSGVWGTGWKGFKYRVRCLQFAEIVEAPLCYLDQGVNGQGEILTDVHPQECMFVNFWQISWLWRGTSATIWWGKPLNWWRVRTLHRYFITPQLFVIVGQKRLSRNEHPKKTHFLPPLLCGAIHWVFLSIYSLWKKIKP